LVYIGMTELVSVLGKDRYISLPIYFADTYITLARFPIVLDDSFSINMSITVGLDKTRDILFLYTSPTKKNL
jgi:hypothetical protein